MSLFSQGSFHRVTQAVGAGTELSVSEFLNRRARLLRVLIRDSGGIPVHCDPG